MCLRGEATYWKEKGKPRQIRVAAGKWKTKVLRGRCGHFLMIQQRVKTQHRKRRMPYTIWFAGELQRTIRIPTFGTAIQYSDQKETNNRKAKKINKEFRSQYS